MALLKVGAKAVLKAGVCHCRRTPAFYLSRRRLVLGGCRTSGPSAETGLYARLHGPACFLFPVAERQWRVLSVFHTVQGQHFVLSVAGGWHAQRFVPAVQGQRFV